MVGHFKTTFEAFDSATDADEVVAAFSEHVKRRVFVVTGPTPKGIGEGTILALAQGGPSALLLVGRNPTKYASVADAVHAINPSIDVRVYGIDLGSLTSVRAGAAAILADFSRVDVLINNAASSNRKHVKTVDGVEDNFATNHLGHWLLTNLLMPALLQSDAPRVVNVSSIAHREGTCDFSDYNFERKKFTWQAAYAQSKVANILFSRQLAALLGPCGLTSFSVHPGVIWGTNIGQDLPSEDLALFMDEIKRVRQLSAKTVGQGSATTCVAALDPKLRQFEVNGAYLEDCQVAEARFAGDNKNTDHAAELWRLSEQLVGQQFVYEF
ncbi:NAD(P)-binding protein [Exidia glandulosa HHB12029]|uniref:NAD(P)-binding protein n=1 Tax=Exidia glandulosa HHB12029 TaxID=1314781 RepID=A0A165NJW2_EXIGL|nr:NAD(P)-binding protein [Exidia glandulosa HHB12029]